MITRYRIWNSEDGSKWVPLDGIEDSIIITDIMESRPTFTMNSNVLGNGGLLWGKRIREGIEVTVEMEVHEYDIEKRTRAIEKVCEWARDGYIKTNTRNGKRLPVIVKEIEGVTSALRWTDKITIIFASTYCPCWETEKAQTVSVTGGTAVNLKIQGTEAGGMANVSVTNNSGSALTQVKAQVGESWIIFSNSSGILAAGATLNITHDSRGRIVAKVGSNSVLQYRTAGSYDDLYCKIGTVNTKFDCTSGCTATFTVRGRWK